METDIQEVEERSYAQGYRASQLRMLREITHELGTDDPLAEAADMLKERTEAIGALRDLCAKVGDNDWDDDQYLADIIRKHLADYVAEHVDRSSTEHASYEVAIRLDQAGVLMALCEGQTFSSRELPNNQMRIMAITLEYDYLIEGTDDSDPWCDTIHSFRDLRRRWVWLPTSNELSDWVECQRPNADGSSFRDGFYRTCNSEPAEGVTEVDHLAEALIAFLQPSNQE